MKIDSLLNTESLKKARKMRKLNILILIVLMSPIVFATPSYIFKIDQPADLKISCFDIDKNLCNNAVTCYLTMHYPDQVNLYSNASMTQASNLDWFNLTLNGLNKSGEYPTIVRCVGNTTGYSTFSIEVNPTGLEQTSILDNPMLLIIGILAVLLVIMGAYFHSPSFGFIGSIMFLFAGIYTMIYGFNNVLDLYTRGIGITFIGIGFVFMFLAAYEWVWGKDD